jgi:hypothetical protein
VKIVGDNTTVSNNKLQWTNGTIDNYTKGCILIAHDKTPYSGIVTKNQIIGGGSGIYYNTGSGTMTIDRNTIVRYKYEGVSARSGPCTIKNNIVSSSPEGTAVTGSVGVYRLAGTLTCSYNDVYLNATNYTAGLVMGTGAITAEALFVSVANNDYNLTASSPCIGAGEGGVDMGALPYSAPGPSYSCPVGTAASWTWATPSGGNTVMSGTPADWTWRTWQAGSGRQVPQGSAEAWTWGDE